MSEALVFTKGLAVKFTEAIDGRRGSQCKGCLCLDESGKFAVCKANSATGLTPQQAIKNADSEEINCVARLVN